MKKLRSVLLSLFISLIFVLILQKSSFAHAMTEDETGIRLYEKTYTKAPNPLKTDKKLYPLSGEVTYGVITKEQVDYALSQGYALLAEDRNGEWWDAEHDYEKYLETVLGDKGLTATAVDLPITLMGDNASGSYTKYILDLAGWYEGKWTESQQQIRNLLAEYLNSFDWKNASEYERADRAIKFIADRCDYEGGVSQKVSSLWDTFFAGKNSCEGFADAFYMVARCSGLNVINARHTAHAWSYVEIDGKWYEIDLDGSDDENVQEFIDIGACTLDQVLEFSSFKDRTRVK